MVSIKLRNKYFIASFGETTLPSGKVIRVKPLAVADLADHSKTANDDNMHDLCLPAVPKGAVLNAVTIGANQIQDPNGDPNEKQKLTR